jgi:ribosomal protein S18 acetylase RimI-like enzyme
MESTVQIRPVRDADLGSLRETVNEVCSEKWYLAAVEGFTLEQSRDFLKHIIDNGLPEVVAVDGDRIVGWCDILPNTTTGFTHVGRLGMGVAGDYRRKGIGRRLLNACLSLAVEYGLEKVELEVFSDNIPAIRLYESVGFNVEGLKSNARKIEGRYQDIQLMALSF